MKKGTHNIPHPSKKALRRGWGIFVLLEVLGLYAFFVALQYCQYYPELDKTSHYLPMMMGYNGATILTIVLYAIYAVGVFFATFFDWPVSKNAQDVYDITHESAKWKPRLKLVDDIISMLRNRASSTTATTIYNDVQNIKIQRLQGSGQDNKALPEQGGMEKGEKDG